MKIREVVMQRYMRSDQAAVELPEQGIVLFVGRNGSGKSQVLEGVATALWGESLRSSSPWHPGRSGAVRVTGSPGTVTRSVNAKHVKTVRWSGCEDDSLTASKAQALLDQVLPPFSTWCKTHVFSADVLDNFSNATDKQRKQLLEDIIRLDKFDLAQEAAKRALSDAKVRHSQHTQALASTRVEIKRLQAVVSELQSLQAGGSEVELQALRDRAKALSADLAQARQRAAEGQVALQTWTGLRADKAARQNVARDTLRRLASGVCPTCGQEAKDCLEAAERTLQDLEAQLKAVGPAPELRSLDQEVLRLNNDLQAVIQQGVSMKEALQRNADLEGKLHGIRSQIAELEHSLPALEAQVTAAREDIELEEACVAVLGLKGIRAHLLSGALAALESGANYWLARFYPNNDVQLQIHMAGDSVAFVVTGLAHNVGYKALSSGQKRRINLAVVMSLGSLAGYAGGQAGGGTIFFDEVLDTLDQEGYEAAASVLREIAEENCVVVISHSRELVRRLRPDVIYKVDNGKYTRVNSAEDSLPEPTELEASGA